jgi:DNA polymerase V
MPYLSTDNRRIPMYDTPEETISLYRIDTSTSLLIPEVKQTGIHAGFPSPATDYMQERIDLNRALIKNPASTFIADVTGDCMIDVFVANPCRVIVDRSETPCNNDIVIATLEGEFMVRLFEQKNGMLRLLPQNARKRYQPIVVREGMDFEIWGVVTQILIDPRVRHFYDRFS